MLCPRCGQDYANEKISLRSVDHEAGRGIDVGDDVVECDYCSYIADIDTYEYDIQRLQEAV